MLDIYSGILEKGNDRRWRIEHAQVIHPDDFRLFGDYNIVPSVQPTHATSDMYWAEERLGSHRMAGAYSYKTLLGQLGWIPNGSDFPVEDINPLYGFYAAVSRKDKAGLPREGFIPSEALSREEALKAMTSWAAKAAFEEKFKGSLEKGKLADFVVTKEDIMTAPEITIPDIRVVSTFSGGEQVYGADEL
jgi:predicted amidohydrolase YtcJ